MPQRTPADAVVCQFADDLYERPWLKDFERRLVSAADHVLSAVPFDLAIVGEEVSGYFHVNNTDERLVDEPNQCWSRQTVVWGAWDPGAPLIESEAD